MSESSATGLLSKINSPLDLKHLSEADLGNLAIELRNFLIDTVSKTGGHLGSNLGSVELTLAMHYVYNTPRDQIVWDVGCQAYTHKIITGRRDRFHTNRQYQGIAGFPRRDESEYDSFGAGHASTSISAALGMAKAREISGEDFKVLAVIGDGGMTGGLAFEGLNNAGGSNTDITVVYNDNRMAISPNVGALSNMLSNIRTDLRFEKIKDNLWELAGRLPKSTKLQKAMHGMGEGFKSMLMPGMWFERLGFRYIGPINGHDLPELISMLKWVRRISGPVVVHVITEKGKGYQIAELDDTHLHGVSKFDPQIGPQKKKQNFDQLNFCQHFSEELTAIAADDDKICAITPAMIAGSALSNFQSKFPNRCFDVGIAEEHALTFAAGLATQGMKPVVAIYSTFLQRAYDQLIHDIALQDLPIVLGIDRAGIVGEDGPTHHGVFDLSYLRHIPGLSILAPRDGNELRLMLREAIKVIDSPVAIRFPRGSAPKLELDVEQNENIWQPEFLKEGTKGVIISAGPLLENCFNAAQTLKKLKKWNIAVLNLRCIKPLDQDFMKLVAKQFNRWLVLEENVLMGGMGSMLLEFLSDNNINSVKVKRLGIPDKFVSHGDRSNLWRELGFDEDSIVSQSVDFFGRFVNPVSRRVQHEKVEK
ncbi:MAG: 1-deoxy-D-xylulose-5-phosphate synthase [Calditrichaeota bacterium]|nr:1-deoxy-D-xylulose-5-phosphate synthase [Calditrichota bacterium]